MNLDKSSAYNTIVILGTGGVGGYFGGLFALNITSNFKDKRNIVFIARGAHLEAIKREGLTLKLYKQKPLKCIPNVITDHVLDLPYINFLLVAVKNYDLEDAIREVEPRLNSDTVIMPLLNGVDSYRRIKNIAEKSIVLPSCVYISSKIEKPGVVALMGDTAKIYSGPDPDRPGYDGQEIEDFFKNMGMKIYWNSKPFESIWRKYLFVAPFSLVTGATGKTMHEAFCDPELRGSLVKIMKEITAIAEKKGILLTNYDIEYALKIGENIAPDARSSFQIDIENKKSKIEIDAFGYTIMREGKENGISVPETEKFVRLIASDMISV